MRTLLLTLVVWAFLAASVLPGDAPPEPAIVLPCRVTEVYDGDTVTVELTLAVRVRLEDCWAPEIRTRDPVEKARGLAARDYLRSRIDGRPGTLAIPLTGARRLDDVLTLDRILGRLYVDGRDVAADMRDAGHATAEKPDATQADRDHEPE